MLYGYSAGRDDGITQIIRRTLLRYTAIPTLVGLIATVVLLPWLIQIVGGGSVDENLAWWMTMAFMIGVVPYLFEKFAGELLTIEGEAKFLATRSTATTYGLSIPLAAVAVFVLNSPVLAIAVNSAASALLAGLFWQRLNSRRPQAWAG